MKLDKKDILKALETITIAGEGKNMVESGAVKNVVTFGDEVIIDLILSTPAMHIKKRAEDDIKKTILELVSADAKIQIKSTVVVPEPNEIKGKAVPGMKNIIAIASGKGGVGKSTLTANLAAGLAQAGFTVGLIDADIYGPSMPTMFDVVGQRPTMVEVNGKSLIEPVENYKVKLLSIGFFTDQQNAVVWRGPMASKALTQMITEGNWGKLDYLLIDLPPGTGDIHLSLLQTLPLDGVVIISTPQEVALADARRGINMFRVDGLNVPIVGIVENMAWFTPEELPENKYYIFGRDGAKNLANGMGIEFLGAIPLVQSIREAGDVGRPAVLQKGSVIGLAFDELVHNFTTRLNALKQ
jgi:ATP-binding protein involved in chromosome partitioning